MTSEKRLLMLLAEEARGRGWERGDRFSLTVLDIIKAHNNRLPDIHVLAQRMDRTFCIVNSISKRTAAEAATYALDGVLPDDGTETNVDIAVMTAMQLEAAAVTLFLEDLSEHVDRIGTISRRGRLRHSRTHRSVVVVHGDVGNNATAALTSQLLTTCTPRILLFVGVAGGLKDAASQGTVVAATDIYDYSALKEGKRGPAARIKTFSTSYALRRRADVVAHDESWLTLARTVPQTRTQGSKAPSVLVKPIVAGPVLLADLASGTGEWIRAHCDDAVAIEMEGVGFSLATGLHPGLQTLVVRGISDRVDDKTMSNDERWQPIAAARAAAFALATADAYLASPPGGTDER
ncbi:hypothetical protein ACQHIV_13050 [Kribbella sp. GL6]|uniref:5'-methylthioadenosine/S-adenosylhomocysteine nucleosidase family protein n=1 Tax=Kribbella sp. GL6 TaxID=3419765 RepID=UPI003D002C48